ncbi:hypothetical protein BJ508DRAFT_316187 [Ascobolus immersus RN42]|uniref:Uncharacterized protein n=1 Tax=Ascobolus immersus RN42 TaxID=1160509 RepID=A0A3N4H7F8_ASCIM|nr:hypothetical protein BJ508DRAFT_316187 [Ascobolus immersus RN42]
MDDTLPDFQTGKPNSTSYYERYTKLLGRLSISLNNNDTDLALLMCNMVGEVSGQEQLFKGEYEKYEADTHTDKNFKDECWGDLRKRGWKFSSRLAFMMKFIDELCEADGYPYVEQTRQCFESFPNNYFKTMIADEKGLFPKLDSLKIERPDVIKAQLPSFNLCLETNRGSSSRGTV